MPDLGKPNEFTDATEHSSPGSPRLPQPSLSRKKGKTAMTQVMLESPSQHRSAPSHQKGHPTTSSAHSSSQLLHHGDSLPTPPKRSRKPAPTSITTPETSAGDRTPPAGPVPSLDDEPNFLIDDEPQPPPDNKPQPHPDLNNPQHIPDELLTHADIKLETLLLGSHKCNRGCGESWIQDLSRFVSMVKLDRVQPGTEPTIQQSPYHKPGASGKWYCVFKGKLVGVFNNW